MCRDPWVVYTVCSSLLRVVITGLYDDKSPKVGDFISSYWIINRAYLKFHFSFIC